MVVTAISIDLLRHEEFRTRVRRRVPVEHWDAVNLVLDAAIVTVAFGISRPDPLAPPKL